MRECEYPLLFSEQTLKCENYTEVKCGNRTEYKSACKYDYFPIVRRGFRLSSTPYGSKLQILQTLNDKYPECSSNTHKRMMKRDGGQVYYFP